MAEVTPFIDNLQVVELFAQQHNWQDKYRQIMQLAKQLPAMEAQWQTDDYLVKGCEASVWLRSECCPHSGQFSFQAYSNARIVRGLLVILLAAVQNKTAQQLETFDMEHYFQQLQLAKHLSPSRNNGIHGIMQQIKQLISQ